MNFGFFSKKDNTRPDWLIAGLGNPGEKYAMTRHNLGWIVAIKLADKYKGSFRQTSGIYYSCLVEIEGYKVMIALPTTYMNASGEAINKIKNKYELSNDRILIISDEYNFPVGKVNLRSDGSDGGHNGVASVINELESSDFLRLRCGIGKNFPPGGMVDYVLSPFGTDEIAMVDKMTERAIGAIGHLLKNGIVRAMSDINSSRFMQVPENGTKNDKADID